MVKRVLIIIVLLLLLPNFFVFAEDNTNDDIYTLTPSGNAQLIDNISSNNNLQFITVNARQGNVFYLIIDHAKKSQNVYFLNKVDENDLSDFVDFEALKKEYTKDNISETAPLIQQKSETDYTTIFSVLLLLFFVGTTLFAYFIYKNTKAKKDKELTFGKNTLDDYYEEVSSETEI